MLTSKTSPAMAHHDGETLRLVLRRAELAACLERFVPGDGMHPTPIPGLYLLRMSQAGELTHGQFEPALCVVAQGSKRVLMGDDVTVYDALHHLVVSQNVPVAGQVLDASPNAPYLCVRLDIDLADVASLVLGMGRPVGVPAGAAKGPSRGLYAAQTGEALLDAVLRLVHLLDTPDDIPTLAPLVVREIMYRLLCAEDGWRLAQIATPGSQGQHISRAIAWLRERYCEPLKVEDLARAVHMSVSSLHHHFKAVTAMSPLQYQKQLRLQEARRLLLMSDAADAAGVGHRVGYESASHFSRDYARLFGAPPARDIRRLRQLTMGGS